MLNLTPHAITLQVREGTEVIFSTSGKVARLTTEERVVGHYETQAGVGSVPIVETRVVGKDNIPDPMSNIQFIVSSMVLDSLDSEYHGLAFAPDTGSTAIRDYQGRIVAVTQFRTVPKEYSVADL